MKQEPTEQELLRLGKFLYNCLYNDGAWDLDISIGPYEISTPGDGRAFMVTAWHDEYGDDGLQSPEFDTLTKVISWIEKHEVEQVEVEEKDGPDTNAS